ENNDLSTMDLPYVARPKDIDLAISVTSDKSTKWGWISIQEYKNIKVKQLKFLISSIEKTTDEVMLQKLIKALLEFDSYNVTTYFDWHAYSAGIETLVNFDKQAVDVLKLVTSKNGLSDDIKEYARKGLLQLSEKVDPSAMLGKTAVDLDTLKTDGRNVVLRFMNETYETNDNVIQSMFFNKVYKEADLLNGKLSPYTLSVLFRDDVLSYIGQTSNPELSILAGITKDMIELERTNSDIKGFKNAKIEEFKEKYEEIKGLVKK
ncbi:MAG: hypothetical protein WCQ53_08930, partial [bacterium]